MPVKSVNGEVCAAGLLKEITAHPEALALFLDLDGTVLDIAARPEEIVIPAGLAKILRRIEAGFGGALAVITGRPVADVDRFLTPFTPIVAGVHGAQLRVSGEGETRTIAKPLEPALIQAVACFALVFPGVLVEPKGQSIAVHYREVPEAEPEIEAGLLRLLERTADHLILLKGRRVLEIVPGSVSKGEALATLMGLPVFAGRRPVMIGDDASDEAAFAVAQRLGGWGLKVAGEHFAESKATFQAPVETRAWLMELAGCLEAPPPATMGNRSGGRARTRT